MKISELTQGFKFYDCDKFDFTWYEYLMPMPVKNPVNKGNYHIIINKKSEKPESWYINTLQLVLNKNLLTIEDVRKHQIKLVEDYLKYLKNETTINE